MTFRQRLALSVAATVLAAIFAAALVVSVPAQPTLIAPTATVTTVTTATPIQIVGVNPSRRAFQICAATNPILFAPVNPAGMTAVTVSATVGIPVAAGTCFISANVTASGTSGGVGAAINAISTGGNAPTTVLEY